MRSFRIYKSLSLFFILISCSTFNEQRIPAQSQPFDEVYGTTSDQPDERKKVRSVYRDVLRIYEKLSEKERLEIAENSLKDFSGDNALLAIPRILSDVEYDQISSGVDQRARAIQAFLNDHYGDKKYLKDRIIPKQMIDEIVKRSLDNDWEKYIKPGLLNFWYGPDIIRGPPENGFPEGRFYVVEDNLSFIGGVGDLVAAKDILDKYVPSYSKVVDSPDPKDYFLRLTTSYKERAKKFGGKAVMIQYPKENVADHEDERSASIFKESGIDVVHIDPFDDNIEFEDGKRLIRHADALYLESKSLYGNITRERVGYVIVNMDPQFLELTHPGNKKHYMKLLIETILEYKELSEFQKDELHQILRPSDEKEDIDFEKFKKFLSKNFEEDFDDNERLGLTGALDLMLQGKIGMTNTPGVDFIGDKAFYINIERLISYYLDEEPILKNIETGSFALFKQDNSSVLNQEEFERVFKNLDKFVIKAADGRGGDAVWVGPKIKAEEIPLLMKKIKNNPSDFIFQAYLPLSTIDGNIGDLRLISDVYQGNVELADVPW